MSVLEEYLELVRAATAEIESLRQQLAESNVILQEAQALRSRLADLEAERALLVTRAENAEAALVEAEAKIAELREALGCEMDDTRNACAAVNAEIDRVNKRLAEAERDAARYRYMRGNASFRDRNGPGLYWYLPRFLPGGSAEQLDASIDASITADSASVVQYKPCEICTTQSWCETHGCQCYPTEAMCCVDYPRCDCNSPPESEGAE